MSEWLELDSVKLYIALAKYKSPAPFTAVPSIFVMHLVNVPWFLSSARVTGVTATVILSLIM